ncbi:FAD/NAD(P)-binding domain-containing protein [Rhizodiscina lignyota]|uniref:FAD/NAD(P)-binding domain-containing protein n=1 Tax=Rhizodiscina lignyota TaxID=1504668 RepID=A0A9P4I5I5_9PEZI|nr:FAD/NAD(P)-binding domain-containing protein [Rhizodiscina lignyota]
MKIIIIGAGISGLSNALLLKKHLSPILAATSSPLTIHIYESHAPRAANAPLDSNDITLADLSSSTALVGGGLGVGPNGMRALRFISESLYERVKAQGWVVKRFVFKSAYGWRLSSVSCADREGKDAKDAEYTVSSSRHGIWAALRDEVDDGASVTYRKVVEVKPGEEGGRGPRVVFEDGEEEEADLVIGADGIRSVVRKAIAKARGEEEGDAAKRWSPNYVGLIGVGGFLDQPPSEDTARDESMTFVFGPQGFFGYGAAAKDKLMWWSTCESPDEPDRSVVHMDDLEAKTRHVHQKWTDPVVQEILGQVKIDTVYPTWTIDELPTWGENGLIIVGDAAHALQPTSGQGSSQALEDAKCLSLLLAHYIEEAVKKGQTDFGDAIHKSSKALYEIRNPVTTQIATHANRMAMKKKQMSKFEEYMLYFMIWCMGKLEFIGKSLIARLYFGALRSADRLLTGINFLSHAQKQLWMWDGEKEVNEYIKRERVKTAEAS